MNYEYLISFHITPKAPRFFGKIFGKAFGKECNPSSLRVTRKAEPLVFQEIPLAEKIFKKNLGFPNSYPKATRKLRLTLSPVQMHILMVVGIVGKLEVLILLIVSIHQLPWVSLQQLHTFLNHRQSFLVRAIPFVQSCKPLTAFVHKVPFQHGR